MVKVQQIGTGKIIKVSPSMARVLMKLGKHIRYDEPEIEIAPVAPVPAPPVPEASVPEIAVATSDDPAELPQTNEPAVTAADEPAEKPKRQYRRRDMSADKAEG